MNYETDTVGAIGTSPRISDYLTAKSVETERTAGQVGIMNSAIGSSSRSKR